MTVRDPGTGQSISATWTWEVSTFEGSFDDPSNPPFLGVKAVLKSGPCQEGYVYRN